MYYRKKITVVTIAQNSAKVLDTAFRSFAYQDYENMEWLIVDNHSDDETVSLVEQYALKDSRIRLIKNERPMKVAEIYNQVIPMAEGSYIALLEPTDIWVQHKIRKQVGFMIRYNAAVSHTSYAFIDNDCNILPVGCRRIAPLLNLVNYRSKTRVCLSTSMFATNDVKKHLPMALKDNDKDPLIFLMRKGLISHGLSDVLTLCRLRFAPPTPAEHAPRIEKLSSQIKAANKVLPNTLRFDAFKAENVADIDLDTSSYIGKDVYASIEKLKKLQL